MMKKYFIVLQLIFMTFWPIASFATPNEDMLDAINKGRVSRVHSLISAGADVNAKIDNKGTTILIHAVFWGDAEICKMLIENGADVNARDEEGVSPLLRVSETMNVDILKVLLEKGANVSLKDRNDESALEKACRVGNYESVKLLLDRLPTDTFMLNLALLQAVDIGNVAIVKSLLAKGADVNAKDKTGKWSAIEKATLKNDSDIVKLLIDKGLVDRTTTNSAIRIAKLNDYSKIVSLLTKSEQLKISLKHLIVYFAGILFILAIMTIFFLKNKIGSILILPSLQRPIWSHAETFFIFGALAGAIARAIYITLMFSQTENPGPILLGWSIIVASFLIINWWKWAPFAALIFVRFILGLPYILVVAPGMTILIGVLFGGPTGMIIGTIVGHFRSRRISKLSDTVLEGNKPYLFGLVLPTVFLCITLPLYYFWVNPMLIDFFIRNLRW